MSWFKRAEKFIVVEVDKSVAKLPELTEDLKASLAALGHTPAFQYLVQRMETEKATLEKYLHEGFQLSEAQMHHLQAGVHYLGYIKREVERLTSQASKRVEREATAVEQDAFERAKSALEFIE